MPNFGLVYEQIVYTFVIMESYLQISTEPFIFKQVRNSFFETKNYEN